MDFVRRKSKIEKTLKHSVKKFEEKRRDETKNCKEKKRIKYT